MVAVLGKLSYFLNFRSIALVSLSDQHFLLPEDLEDGSSKSSNQVSTFAGVSAGKSFKEGLGILSIR